MSPPIPNSTAPRLTRIGRMPAAIVAVYGWARTAAWQNFVIGNRANFFNIYRLETMAEQKKHNYDESKIKTLSSLEHIRLRTGMYIGRIGNGSHYDDGCYILLKEVIDNAIDEYIMGYGKEVQIEIQDK